jgi:hypothetical protein
MLALPLITSPLLLLNACSIKRCYQQTIQRGQMQPVVMQLHWAIFAGAGALSLLASMLAMLVLVNVQLVMNACDACTMALDRNR